MTDPIRFVPAKLDTLTVVVPRATASGFAVEIIGPLLDTDKYTLPITFDAVGRVKLTGMTALLELCILTVPITFDAVGRVKLTGMTALLELCILTVPITFELYTSGDISVTWTCTGSSGVLSTFTVDAIVIG